VSDFMYVAAVIGVFFLFGIAFGVLGVISASALRTDAERAARKRAKRARRNADQATGWMNADWRGGWTDTIAIGREEPPGPDADGGDSTPPRWPGG
jgi:hypothetical protein